MTAGKLQSTARVMGAWCRTWDEVLNMHTPCGIPLMMLISCMGGVSMSTLPMP